MCWLSDYNKAYDCTPLEFEEIEWDMEWEKLVDDLLAGQSEFIQED